MPDGLFCARQLPLPCPCLGVKAWMSHTANGSPSRSGPSFHLPLCSLMPLCGPGHSDLTPSLCPPGSVPLCTFCFPRLTALPSPLSLKQSYSSPRTQLNPPCPQRPGLSALSIVCLCDSILCLTVSQERGLCLIHLCTPSASIQ